MHAELRPEGIHAATVTIASGVVPGGGEADPDAIGVRYHRLYQQPGTVEEVIGDLAGFRALVARYPASTATK